MWPPTSSRKSLSVVPDGEEADHLLGVAVGDPEEVAVHQRVAEVAASGRRTPRSAVDERGQPLLAGVGPALAEVPEARPVHLGRPRRSRPSSRSGCPGVGRRDGRARSPDPFQHRRRLLERVLGSTAWPATSRTTSRPRSWSASSALYGPFTDAVRDLVDATIRTLVDDDEIRRGPGRDRGDHRAAAQGAARRARTASASAPTGRGRPWGNTVVGLRNPVAPPLVIEHDPSGDGRVWSDFHLGAAYEGPPDLVHGGVAALILDQMLGEAAGAGGKPGMTGTLTLTYRQGTPLGDLRSEAWVERGRGHQDVRARATSSAPTGSPWRPRACSSCRSGRAS